LQHTREGLHVRVYCMRGWYESRTIAVSQSNCDGAVPIN
jgi:hypothetical protein